MTILRQSDMDTVERQTKVANILLSKIDSLIGRVASLETRLEKSVVEKPCNIPVIVQAKRKKGAVK